MAPSGTATPHRTLDVEQAIAIASREIDRIGARADVRRLAGDGDFPTYRCLLYNDRGEQIAYGAGKGYRRQSLASCLFEALEHYYALVEGLAPGEGGLPVRVLRAGEVAEQPALGASVVVRRLARDYPGAKVGCAAYAPYGGGEPLWYPLFLTHTRYADAPCPGDDFALYRSLHRYTNNSGIAAGSAPDDSVLHGGLELIERDAYSLALLDWFVARSARPLRVVDPSGLPPRLRGLHQSAEAALGGPVLLIDITCDEVGVPVYLASVPVSPFPAGLTGAGASLHPEYAAERALSELLQVWHITREQPDGERRKVGRVARWPALRACVEQKLSDVIGRFGSQPCGLRDARPPAAGASPGAGVDEIARRLRGLGLQLFTRRLTRPDSLVTVTSLVVPGIEQFFLVSAGIPLLPTGRGMARWPGGQAPS